MSQHKSEDLKESKDTEDFFPDRQTLPALREAAADCQACDLYKRGTQTVFGAGTRNAEVLFVGEQPGNDEDLEGEPFVGPAGKLLDNALEEAGIDRQKAYVTNVVKHFKWEPRGKRRIHKKPNAKEIAACRPWLEQQLQIIEPDIIVCVGAPAARQMLGKDFKLTQQRGQWFEGPNGAAVLPTIHPAYVLIQPEETYDQLIQALNAIPADVLRQECTVVYSVGYGENEAPAVRSAVPTLPLAD